MRTTRSTILTRAEPTASRNLSGVILRCSIRESPSTRPFRTRPQPQPQPRPARVSSKSDPGSLSKTYSGKGATVTPLQPITLDAGAGITFGNENITFDGANKTLELNATIGKIAFTVSKNSTLQNLSVTAKSDATFGTAFKLLGGWQTAYQHN